MSTAGISEITYHTLIIKFLYESNHYKRTAQKLFNTYISTLIRSPTFHLFPHLPPDLFPLNTLK
jgi:hypothetical protein